MKPSIVALGLTLCCATADAAFFLDTDRLLKMVGDFRTYQEDREIRYMAKASQYIGYVTGIADASDGSKFCLPGGMDAEKLAGIVADSLQSGTERLPPRAIDTVTTALASRFPCKP